MSENKFKVQMYSRAAGKSYEQWVKLIDNFLSSDKEGIEITHIDPETIKLKEDHAELIALSKDLRKINRIQRAENKKLDNVITGLIKKKNGFMIERDALKKALGFYADTDVWSPTGQQHCPAVLHGEDIEYIEECKGFIGGKVARDVLAKHKKVSNV